MTISPMPMEAHLIARTKITNGKREYEISTIDLRRYPIPLPWRYNSVDVAGKPFETAVFKLTPDGTRDMNLMDLYLKRSSNIEDASLVHDEAVQSFLSGQLPLIPFTERLSMYGLCEM